MPARCAGLAAGAAVLASVATAAPASETCAPKAGATHGVVRVIDGETLLLDSGEEVRLIGALAPKPDTFSAEPRDAHRRDVHGRDWPPAQDAVAALEALVSDRSVTLRYEGQQRDRYGRALAQVYVGGAEPEAAVWAQEMLIRNGHARAYALPGNSGCLSALLKAEAAARAAKHGLWQRETYRVRSAGDVDTLLRQTGRFTLVEGRVAQVTRAQRTTYINFGADWRHDFTASLATAVIERDDADTKRVAALAGRSVRVRGWIERRNGPMIVLGSLDEIEVLAGPDEIAIQPETETPR